MFTLLRAFDLATWVLILVFLPGTAAALTLISRAEDSFNQGQEDMFWSDPVNSGWYIFGTFVGESMTSLNEGFRAWAIRNFICAWFMFAFVITASYGGNLRAFLLSPVMSEPIDTLADILASGLGWRLVEYHDWMQTKVETSDNQMVQEYWRERNVVKYEDFPFEQVWDRAEAETKRQ